MTAQPCYDPAQIGQEIERIKRSGPLQTLVMAACPPALLRLRELAAQGAPDLTEAARLVRSDAAMAAALIHGAHSAAPDSQPQPPTIDAAIRRLGLAHTARLMTAHLLRRAVRVSSPHLGRFWERATLRAQIMQRMAAAVPGLDEDEAYTHGLFVDIGHAVMVQNLPGYASTLVEIDARPRASAIELENARHRSDHAVVGALMARLWRLSPTVMAAIRRHHDLEALGQGDDAPAVHTLVAAGLIAAHLLARREALPDTWEWQRHGGAALACLCVSEKELRDWQDHWLPQLQAA